ncbi:MAG: tetratricopeptide repeat protein, partial [Candidatus Electryonea clarkiae]|nr:tetratricopeptide repeat protein [Candidatus Electryonea clarkiae]
MFLKINKLKFQIRKIIVGSSIFVVLILLLFGIKWIISNHLLDSQSAYSLFILSLSKTIESGDYSTEDLYWRGTLYRGIVLKKSLKLSKSKYSKEGKDKRTERLNKYYILALNDFNAVLEIDPNYKDTNIQKIDVLTDLKRHDEALEECDKILQGDAENIKIL